MKILVTGADGMLGTHTVRELISRGHFVKTFLLLNSPSKSLGGLSVEKIFGNILNREEVIKATTGCDALIHIAANTNVWPTRSKIVNAVNIDGTKNIIEAVKKNKVKRYVHIGSASSFAFGSKEKPGDESSPFAGHKYGLDYVDSKYKAQQLVLKSVKEDNLPALIVCPTFMFGPYDSKPGSGQMILAVYKKQLPAYASGGKNFVHVNDVALAICNALSMGRTGECYIAGNQNLNYQEITSLIAKELNVQAPKIQVPDFMIKTAGLFGGTFGKLFKFEPKLSLATAKVACDGQYFSIKKAVQELSMPQTDIRVAVKEAFAWFKENGYC